MVLNTILNWFLSALAIFAIAYFLPGVYVAGFFTAVVVALVLGLVNAFVKPVVLLLTLPINILTLGLFTLVVNTLMVLLATWIVPGFEVSNFLWALLFSVVLWFVNIFLKGSAKSVNPLARG